MLLRVDTIIVYSRDKTHPELVIENVPRAEAFRSLLNRYIRMTPTQRSKEIREE
jgi:hypothetical protein